jgi:hypothetical protein
MPEPGLYRRHFEDPQRERALLSAIGFTAAFGAARGITHSIRAGVGPFRNISAGGRHIHHSTFGIIGLLGIGFLWAEQIFTGHDRPPRWGSRITAASYGVAAALTLDEFALWLDLQDDYWNAQGRKSIDAVILFAGLLSIAVAGREALDELGVDSRVSRFLTALDIHSADSQDASAPARSQQAEPPASSDGAPLSAG